VEILLTFGTLWALHLFAQNGGRSIPSIDETMIPFKEVLSNINNNLE
jgi:hypothetical protein